MTPLFIMSKNFFWTLLYFRTLQKFSDYSASLVILFAMQYVTRRDFYPCNYLLSYLKVTVLRTFRQNKYSLYIHSCYYQSHKINK